MTTAARERPILFAGRLVRAILDGQKTQTRRVIKPQPPAECGINYPLGNESWIKDPSKRTPLRHTWEAWHGPLYQNRPEKYLCGVHTVASPFGVPGDRLWVRETWAADVLVPGEGGQDEYWYHEAPRTFRTWKGAGYIFYRADNAIVHGGRFSEYEFSSDRPWSQRRSTWKPKPDDLEGLRWLPSIHMPRWASRITLEITDVRAQRLQDITPEDAVAEGAEQHWTAQSYAPSPSEVVAYQGYARYCFALSWNDINGKRGHFWASNPWVWAISFRRVTDG